MKFKMQELTRRGLHLPGNSSGEPFESDRENRAKPRVPVV